MARLCVGVCSLFTEEAIRNLHQRKVFTVLDYLKEDPEKLVQISKLSYKETLQIRHVLISHYAAFPQTGLSAYHDLMTNSAILPTGIARIDNLMQGGLVTGDAIELCGASGAGKSQICLTLTVNIALHLKHHVHYIDTNNDFSGTRVQAILESQGCDEEDMGFAMERIKVTKAQNVYQVLSVLHHLKSQLGSESESSHMLRLIVIDSLPALFFPMLGDKHNEGLGLMNHLAGVMKYIAVELHVVFLLVNLVTKWVEEENPSFTETAESSRDGQSSTSSNRPAGEALKPTLGKYWQHIPSTRLLVQKDTKSEKRLITVLKSTYIEIGKSCSVNISDKGIE